MPIISWSAGDVMQGKTAEAGIYSAELMKYEGPKASNSGKGVNLFLTFRVTEGQMTNKEFTIALSSATNNTSLLGGLQFFPMGQTISKIAAVIAGKMTPDVGDGSCDVDDLLHKPLKLGVAVEVNQDGGTPVNTITAFYPASYSQAPAF
jgi:hypothetical protein